MAAWRAPDDQWLVSCALLTRPAAPALAHIHDRMPVVLPPESFAAWLDRDQRMEDVDALIAGARQDFTGYPVDASATVADASVELPR